MPDFGEILKSLRQSAGLTQKELADKLHMCKTMISYYENSRRYPSADILKLIAEAFHVSVDYLLGREKKEQMIDFDGLYENDIELLIYVAKFLKRKNDEQDQDKKDGQDQKKKGEQDQKKKEEQDQKKKEEQDQKANEDPDNDTATNC